MKPQTSALSLSALQNPFRVARLRAELSALRTVENISRADWDGMTRNFVKSIPQTFSGSLQLLSYALQSELGQETSKPSAVRAYRQTSHGQDDAWRVWVVLNREVSAHLIELARENEAESEGEWRSETGLDVVCAELWAEWGFDAAQSPLSDYSPTGRMFQRSLSARVARNGCVILSQSGARDV